MSAAPRPDAAGLTRRRNRLSDAQTRERMLQAARNRVNREGLTVSLEHISFEDVIRDAQVARSTAYRHWPAKELFFADLVVDLARAGSVSALRTEIDQIRSGFDAFDGDLADPAQRRRLLLELTRTLIDIDLAAIGDSPDWRTYLALHATVAGLRPGDLRERLQQALAESESRRVARVTLAWSQLTTLLGQRVRPELETDLESLTRTLTAVMNGMLLTAATDPQLSRSRVAAGPPGTAAAGSWSLAAVTVGSLVETFLESDPDADWDPSTAARVHAALDEWTPAAPDPTD